MNFDVYTTKAEGELIIPKIVPLYKQVFGDDIWQEGMRGTLCEKKYSYQNTPENGRCTTPECNCFLREFYEDGDVVEMLEGLFKERFTLVLAQERDVAVGFFWGWYDDLLSLETKKLGLGTQFEEFEALVDASDVDIFYFAETGVRSDYRGRGIATGMYEAFLQERRALAPYLLLCRTGKASPQWGLCEKRGYERVFDYNDEDSRSLFVSRIS